MSTPNIENRQPGSHEIGVVANPNAVSDALVKLCRDLAVQGTPAELLVPLELVLAEVMNNIVEHAYSDHSTGEIAVEVNLEGPSVRCRLRDQGQAMPGLQLPREKEFNLANIAVEDLPEGGFGWSLIHSLAYDLEYERKDGENRTSFRIDLAS